MTAILGVYSAATTPLNSDFSPDLGMLATHCRQLLDDGCHGIALLGSTGEANSFSVKERMTIVEAVLAAGIAPDVLLPGTGLCAIPDTVALTRHALQNGITKVVMLPPFYYKGVSEQGLFDAYSAILDQIADDRLRVILYHIPPISQIPLSMTLIGRLCEAYPGTIAGVKDSGGQLDNMVELARAFPQLAILAGADPLMLPLLKKGGAGCITATSNLAARLLRTVFDNHDDPASRDAVTTAQKGIVALRTISNSFAQIPTIKAMLARRYAYAGWTKVRSPLVSLSDIEIAELGAKLDLLGANH